MANIPKLEDSTPEDSIPLDHDAKSLDEIVEFMEEQGTSAAVEGRWRSKLFQECQEQRLLLQRQQLLLERVAQQVASDTSIA